MGVVSTSAVLCRLRLRCASPLRFPSTLLEHRGNPGTFGQPRAGGMAILEHTAEPHNLLIHRQKLDISDEFHTESLDRFERGIQEKTCLCRARNLSCSG